MWKIQFILQTGHWKTSRSSKKDVTSSYNIAYILESQKAYFNCSTSLAISVERYSGVIPTNCSLPLGGRADPKSISRYTMPPSSVSSKQPFSAENRKHKIMSNCGLLYCTQLPTLISSHHNDGQYFTHTIDGNVAHLSKVSAK